MNTNRLCLHTLQRQMYSDDATVKSFNGFGLFINCLEKQSSLDFCNNNTNTGTNQYSPYEYGATNDVDYTTVKAVMTQ